MFKLTSIIPPHPDPLPMGEGKYNYIDSIQEHKSYLYYIIL